MSGQSLAHDADAARSFRRRGATIRIEAAAKAMAA